MHVCFMCVCVCTCVYACACVDACMCVCVCVCVCLSLYVCVYVRVYTRFPRDSGRDDDDIGILQGPIQLFRTEVARHLRRRERSHPA